MSLLVLLLISILLFLCTHFLFRSYSLHQAAVAQNWTERGVKALAAHHPEDAVADFRRAAPYASDERKMQRLLAEALAASGHYQEATAYYRSLWEEEPGSGIINLSLARLAAHRGEVEEAIKNYHAALDGTWDGDGAKRRPVVRMELADYLMSQSRLEQARNELLIAFGNSPEDTPLRLRIASAMERTGDYESALTQYRKILQQTNAPLAAFESAGKAAFSSGEYSLARLYLQKAVNHPDFSKEAASVQDQTREQLRDSIQILSLLPSSNLPQKQRAARILRIHQIVAERIKDCTDNLQSQKRPLPESLSTALQTWASFPNPLKAQKLLQSEDLAEKVFSSALKVEQAAASACGAPSGENALLIKIAETSKMAEGQKIQ